MSQTHYYHLRIEKHLVEKGVVGQMIGRGGRGLQKIIFTANGQKTCDINNWTEEDTGDVVFRITTWNETQRWRTATLMEQAGRFAVSSLHDGEKEDGGSGDEGEAVGGDGGGRGRGRGGRGGRGRGGRGRGGRGRGGRGRGGE